MRLWRPRRLLLDRKSTRLNSSHRCISYAVFCLKKKNQERDIALAVLPRGFAGVHEHWLHSTCCIPYWQSPVHIYSIYSLLFFFLIIRHPRRFTLFPYTTLFG